WTGRKRALAHEVWPAVLSAGQLQLLHRLVEQENPGAIDPALPGLRLHSALDHLSVVHSHSRATSCCICFFEEARRPRVAKQMLYVRSCPNKHVIFQHRSIPRQKWNEIERAFLWLSERIE